MTSGIDSSTYRVRQSRLAATLSDGDLAVVSRGSDIRWLTGFTGSNGLLLVRAGACILLTDGRYEIQASEESAVDDVHIVRGELIESVSGAVDDRIFADTASSADETAVVRVLFQADDLSFQRADKLRELITEDGIAFEALGERLSEYRSAKDAGELALVRNALGISEHVMVGIRDVLRPGVTERAVAAEIDYRHRLEGADGPAFETIVAFGKRAALPHARPGSTRLEEGDCILLDFGCVVDGYRSDITRTMVLGEPPEGFETAYRAVETALCSARDAVIADMDGKELDAVARKSLESDGLSEHFTHSLGHGVGLDIHEHPRVSSVVSSRLAEGAVITIEPGVYLEGRFGIRIENMVYVGSDGGLVLNTLDTGLIRL